MQGHAQPLNDREVDKVGAESVASHGAKAPKAFNIITNALRNMGIVYSDSPSHSYSFTGKDVPFRAWKQNISNFRTNGGKPKRRRRRLVF
ncbi:hypothetical protein J7T55_006987 [Diaporthe amygdali]|uniref:uncharacterized protein n=1 Tax=Phomopsis amygdali TaxID=1214568 RepID=UPI0022FE97CF|nr:uncharacterized protein J7T55_006987 [Diaporthe amygdali]KAJ0104061.1 hypothetical protein J7T55_006987 [Diaporthe amygdali]